MCFYYFVALPFSAHPIIVFLFFCGYTYQASSVSEIYTAINTPTTHYSGWHSSNPDSWTRANNPTSSTSKSIFDPCPYGYRVPTSNANSSGNSDFFGFTTPPNSNGVVWLGFWWPTSGRRNYDSAALSGVDNNGWYWPASQSPSPYPSSAFHMLFYSDYFTPINHSDRSYGMSLRCVQEKKKKFLA